MNWPVFLIVVGSCTIIFAFPTLNYPDKLGVILLVVGTLCLATGAALL